MGHVMAWMKKTWVVKIIVFHWSFLVIDLGSAFKHFHTLWRLAFQGEE
jgi:hypothetical protein